MKKKSKYNFLDAPNMSPQQEYYKSQKITIEDQESLEIKSDLPIQVRINGGDWVDVRKI